MRSILDAYMEKMLLNRRKAGNERHLSLKKQDAIDFASNDYLGLSRNKTLQEQIIGLWQQCPAPYLGSTGSRLLTGNSLLVQELEQFIAQFHEADAGLIFNCGYLANIGLIPTLIRYDDLCLYDSHIHASAHDGMRLSRSTTIPWRHNDLADLETKLKKSGTKQHRFVLIESIYSCDGSSAPLSELCALCQKYGADLIVDEAHATGVHGPLGKGIIALHQCQNNVFASIHTFSKALGIYGAIVLGSKRLKTFLINFCRSFIYTTALPMPVLLGIREAYLSIIHAEKERENLKQLITFFLNEAKCLKLSFLPSQSQIQSILIPGNVNADAAAQQLQHHGFDVRALRSPTVKRGTECLRICLHAYNTKNEIKQLLNHLKHLENNS